MKGLVRPSKRLKEVRVDQRQVRESRRSGSARSPWTWTSFALPLLSQAMPLVTGMHCMFSRSASLLGQDSLPPPPSGIAPISSTHRWSQPPTASAKQRVSPAAAGRAQFMGER